MVKIDKVPKGKLTDKDKIKVEVSRLVNLVNRRYRNTMMILSKN